MIGNTSISVNNLAGSFASESINYAVNGEFNVDIMSWKGVANMMLGIDPTKESGFGGGAFMQSFQQNLLNKDADISRFNSAGYGISFSRKGISEYHQNRGGFDLTEVVIFNLINIINREVFLLFL